MTPNLRFSHYEILAPLGAGCMGESYPAEDTELDWQVAFRRTSLSSRVPAVAKRQSSLWIAGIALAFMAGGLGMWLLRPVSSEIPLRKLELQIAGLELSGSYGYSISPNGQRIAYVGNHRLWIRGLA